MRHRVTSPGAIDRSGTRARSLSAAREAASVLVGHQFLDDRAPHASARANAPSTFGTRTLMSWVTRRRSGDPIAAGVGDDHGAVGSDAQLGTV